MSRQQTKILSGTNGRGQPFAHVQRQHEHFLHVKHANQRIAREIPSSQKTQAMSHLPPNPWLYLHPLGLCHTLDHIVVDQYQWLFQTQHHWAQYIHSEVMVAPP